MMDQDRPAMPSTPMTGPARRRLSSIPQQEGNGESETDFAAYVPPASVDQLQADADPSNRFMPLLNRRRLDVGFGPRRL